MITQRSPEPLLMRRAMSQFATGVTVITTVTADGAPTGCTVSAFSSLSLDPPLVLACVDRGRSMHDLLMAAPGFAVNVLREDQHDVALSFARRGADRFADGRFRLGRHGIPLLHDAIAHVECDRSETFPGGDHTILTGHVRRLAVDDGEPLLYGQGGFFARSAVPL